MRLRGDQIDLGEWRVWGPPNPIAKARELLGLPVRRPQKEDYRYNFAINGAGCKDLNHGWREVDRLLSVVRLDAEQWKRGVVVIRTGVNDIGNAEALEAYASSPEAGVDKIEFCLRQIESSVARLREVQPEMRFVLVGIFNNAHWAPNIEKWQNAEQLANISAALERFDGRLEQVANQDPNVIFFDDQAWFEEHWGTRDHLGRPAYGALTLPSGLTVTNSRGDEPTNAALADGHAGTVWNALWAKSLVDLMNQEFGVGVRPIKASEVEALINRQAE